MISWHVEFDIFKSKSWNQIWITKWIQMFHFAAELASEPFYGWEFLLSPERHLIPHRPKWPKKGIQLERWGNNNYLILSFSNLQIMNFYPFQPCWLKFREEPYNPISPLTFLVSPHIGWWQEYELFWELSRCNFLKKKMSGWSEQVIFSM